MIVRNQTYLRKKNKEEILTLLREKTCSYSELARAMCLSNAAIAKIAEDLIVDGVIQRESETKGRTGINLSINADYGYVFAVDFSKWRVEFCAADFNGKILKNDVMDGIKFQQADINLLIGKLQDWMQDEALKSLKLRSIALASPGKIDKNSGEFLDNPRFEKIDGSLKSIFERAFNCPVVLKNDIKLALWGEKSFGTELKGVDNAMMIHIDVGTGAALFLNGKVYEGARGFSGEIGYFKINTSLLGDDHYQNINLANYFDSLSLFSALSDVKREIFARNPSVIHEWLKAENKTWNDISIQMMINAYIKGDLLVRRILDAQAKIVGSFIDCMAEFLDVEKIILCGSVVELGNAYLAQINASMKNIKAVYSALQERAVMLGAIDVAITRAIEDIL